ncbi:hypothetical protein JIR23_08685 [Bradyrhizobium diazoefficiens]|nr:hypothetical protein [Bradyrhizobium diazoefficiens]QQN65747.1 hypothetical protein JIR23_08685 [Bradyrhizobium diazoefficiens]
MNIHLFAQPNRECNHDDGLIKLVDCGEQQRNIIGDIRDVIAPVSAERANQ